MTSFAYYHYTSFLYYPVLVLYISVVVCQLILLYDEKMFLSDLYSEFYL